MNEFTNTKKNVLIYMLFFAVLHMAFGIYYPFIGLYLNDIGFSVAQIGIITAIGPFVIMVAQPFWGILSDRFNKVAILIIVLIGTLLSAQLFTFGKSFTFVFVVMTIFMVFHMAKGPLSDAAAMQYLRGTGYNFAPVRMLGTIGFAVILLFFSPIIGSNTSGMFHYYSIFMVLCIIISFFLPRTQTVPKENKGKINLWAALSNKKVLLLLAFNLVLNLAYGYYLSFFAIYLDRINISGNLVGIAVSIATFSEIPVLLFIDKFMKRVKPQSILVISGIMYGLRLLIFGQAQDFTAIVIAQLLQGVTFISSYYCSVVMIDEEFPENMKSTAQSILSFVSTGAARIIGSIGGAFISGYIGLSGGFNLIAVIMIIFTLLFAIVYRRLLEKPVKNNEIMEGAYPDEQAV